MDGDEPAVMGLMIQRAEARLGSQLRDSDAMDVKALGILGADAVAIGVLIASHTVLNRFWWIPLVVLSAAAALLLFVVWPSKQDEGPDIRAFWESFGGGSILAVGLQMLSELLAAIEGNDAAAPQKARFFKAGCVLLVFGLIGCAVVGLDRPTG